MQYTACSILQICFSFSTVLTSGSLIFLFSIPVLFSFQLSLIISCSLLRKGYGSTSQKRILHSPRIFSSLSIRPRTARPPLLTQLPPRVQRRPGCGRGRAFSIGRGPQLLSLALIHNAVSSVLPLTSFLAPPPPLCNRGRFRRRLFSPF